MAYNEKIAKIFCCYSGGCIRVRNMYFDLLTITSLQFMVSPTNLMMGFTTEPNGEPHLYDICDDPDLYGDLQREIGDAWAYARGERNIKICSTK